MAGRDGVEHLDGNTVDRKLHTRGKRDARYGHIVRGIQMNRGVLRRGELGNIEEHVLSLPQ